MELNSIYMMDCIEGMKLLPDELVDLVIADPPFGLDFTGKTGGNYNRQSKHILDGYVEVPKDKSYYGFCIRWLTQAKRVLKPNGSMYVYSCWGQLPQVMNAVNDLNFYVRNHLIWRKSFGVHTKIRWTTSHYHILHLVKSEDVRPTFVKTYHKHPTKHGLRFYAEDVLEHKTEYHPGIPRVGTKLPAKQVELLIRTSSHREDLVLDPFIGNGTTAIAAKKLKRDYIGFEMNPNVEPILREKGLVTR